MAPGSPGDSTPCGEEAAGGPPLRRDSLTSRALQPPRGEGGPNLLRIRNSVSGEKVGGQSWLGPIETVGIGRNCKAVILRVDPEAACNWGAGAAYIHGRGEGSLGVAVRYRQYFSRQGRGPRLGDGTARPPVFVCAGLSHTHLFRVRSIPPPHLQPRAVLPLGGSISLRSASVCSADTGFLFLTNARSVATLHQAGLSVAFSQQRLLTLCHCHILIICPIFQTFSLLLYLL